MAVKDGRDGEVVVEDSGDVGRRAEPHYDLARPWLVQAEKERRSGRGGGRRRRRQQR